MGGRQVDYHPAASRELEHALDGYLERSLQAAGSFVREIDQALAVISTAPRVWPHFETGTRRYVLQRFPYDIIYREAGTGIEVIAVAHHRRRPRYWSHRL